MRKMRNLLLTLLMATIVTGNVVAQSEENDSIPPRLREQQEKYERGEGLYPAKKRSKSRLGFGAGYSQILGDVTPLPGLSGQMDFEKALGHVLSLRVIGAYNYAKGLNTKLSKGYINHGNYAPNAAYHPNRNPFMTGLGGAYYSATRNEGVAYNYASKGFELVLQPVLHLGATNFYKEAAKWDLYLGAGPGALLSNTKVDAYKRQANGSFTTYDFESVFAKAPKDEGKLFGDGSRMNRNKYLRKELKKLLDSEAKDGNGSVYNYETNSESDASVRFLWTNRKGLFNKRESKNVWNLFPTLTGSVGARYKLNNLIELALEQRLTFTNSDLLDGVRWSERFAGVGASNATRGVDVWSNTTASLGLRLGKNGTDALWWVNPVNNTAGNLADARKVMKGLGDDTDGDGVADVFDKDPNTPEGVKVDGSGQVLDLDQDGVADSQDEQSYTPKGCPVNERGVAKDADNDGVPDCLDKEANTKTGVLVDNNGKEIKMPEIPKFDCSNCATTVTPPVVTPTTPTVIAARECNLPSVHFDNGGSNIKQEFYPDLYYVAKYMMDHAGTNINVIGSDDKSETIARKRAEAAVNFIVGNFGIDRSRFSISTTGGIRVSSGNSAKNPKNTSLDYLNRRVDFECQ